MRVFVTGATGFVGLAVTRELVGAGHQVLGLVRSDAGAAAIAALGAEARHGSIEDLDGLKRGAQEADGIMHLAFNHNFATFLENCKQDADAIEAMGAAIKGTAKPLLVTSGVAALTPPGQLATEHDALPADTPSPRRSEPAALALAVDGVNAGVMRFSQIHDPVKQGFITYFKEVAREKGVSAYLGDGSHGIAAAHVDDTARLCRLALERPEAGARWHAVAEENVSMRAIAEALGAGLNVPVKSITLEEAPAHFGWLAMFMGTSMAATSAITREKLSWQPTGPGLIADLEAMDYSVA